MSSKSDKEKNLFKKLTALPYLLVLLALLMPLANVSCSAKDDSKPIAQMTLYQIASGVNLDDAIESSALKQMNRMVKENPKDCCCRFGRCVCLDCSACINGDGAVVHGLVVVAVDEAFANRWNSWNPATES